uniref:Uncharacterized protein LOC104210672 n=1 Tax=Nicotiana sylvestris TaxID=4096 RepID=A0A1U7UP61_NICSY|nr:PREDICTED: uncharacterized protein LOC104210672 [Nicotiana sylvestris]
MQIPLREIELVADEFVRVDSIAEMARTRTPSSARRGAGRGTTRGGGQVGAHQTRAQTSRQATPQPEVVNTGQSQATMPNRVQEQMVQDAPPSVPVDVPTVTLHADALVRLLNVLEALVPTQDGLPAPQTTSQAQAQVQLNVAAPQISPQQVVQPVANTGQSKDLKNFIDLKPPEFDATQASIEPQKFIQRCEKILSTLGLKETRGVEFDTFLFSASAESWWNLVQRGRRAGLSPITWSEFSAMFMDRFIPLSKRDDMRHQFEQLR